MSIWRDLPPLSALRAFAAWAETGSVTAAGRALNVSHAAVSQQIRALETHLGLALLDRGVNPPRPTAEGTRLAAALTQGFGGIAAAVAELTGADHGRPLSITTSPSFASAWLLPRLGGFRADHPSADVVIDPSVALRPLVAGGTDIALRYGLGQWPGLEARLLIPSPLVVVAAPALAGDIAEDDMAALTRLPWVVEPGADDRIALFRRHGVAPEATGLLSLPGNLMIEAARAGHGIAITARLFVAADLAAGRLRQMHLIDNGKGYWLVHRPGPLRPVARDFARWILRETAPSRTGLPAV